MTAPLRQFIVAKTDVGYSVSFSVDGGLPREFAANLTLERARSLVPKTHVKADVPVESPIVEVWIDKSVADFGGDRFVCV